MKTGYYLVSFEGLLLPARWDGAFWRSEIGVYPNDGRHKIIANNLVQQIRKFFGLNIQPMSLSCPVGCTCKTNPDGSINVNCT